MISTMTVNNSSGINDIKNSYISNGNIIGGLLANINDHHEEIEITMARVSYPMFDV